MADALPQCIGRYRILCELGRGGMACIYLGRAEGPGGFERLVAIKVIHEPFNRDQRFMNMFLDEARIAARIHHPNVVQVYEIGEDQGRYFIAMDYVSGETLALLLHRAAKQKRTIPVELALHLIAAAADALHAAHELRDREDHLLGVVHRDVSPDNMLVGYDGILRLSDFGVAKATDKISATRSGAKKGKLAYMAPEQVKTPNIDRRADVFSLGVVLWEMLTSHRLFKAHNDAATIDRIAHLRLSPPSALRGEVSSAVDTIVLKALERGRDQRYATAREFAQALRGAAAASTMISSVDVELFMNELFDQRRLERAEMERRARVDATSHIAAPSMQGTISLSAPDEASDPLGTYSEPFAAVLAEVGVYARIASRAIPIVAGGFFVAVAATVILWMRLPQPPALAPLPAMVAIAPVFTATVAQELKPEAIPETKKVQTPSAKAALKRKAAPSAGISGKDL